MMHRVTSQDDRKAASGPPERVLGGPVAINFLVGQSDIGAVKVQHLTAFPTGFEFQVCAYAVLTDEVDVFDPMFGMSGRRLHPEKSEQELLVELVALRVEYSDGMRFSTWPAATSQAAPPSRSLFAMGGGARRSEDGTLWTADSTFWVGPLPPPGEVTFICSWPKYGIANARQAIDAQVILDAAERSTPILPRRPGDPSFRSAY
jgi:hypothetical protein